MKTQTQYTLLAALALLLGAGLIIAGYTVEGMAFFGLGGTLTGRGKGDA